MRGLKHIRTACGQRRSIPPDSSPYSMRSHLSARQPGQQQLKSPYKARVVPPSPQLLLDVQKVPEIKLKMIEDDNCIFIEVELLRTIGDIIQLEIQGDILIMQAKTDDIQFHKEYLLPTKAFIDCLHYSDGILYVNLIKHDEKGENECPDRP